ncbi:ABC transporter ATP-binding protein [Pseudothauera lacus]|uniref:ABC transporter ATP-binding protein n=1 Tax=Pseudothauera lacus TaxID=2136175 RepID=A0A2T4IBR1_9RHOO|nr:ABC transporter ATP-binding protein [Pseudothauera lacus]PTD95156.1 ABC transporter ATP-binding protein [Pseudothauera lacus]
MSLALEFRSVSKTFRSKGRTVQALRDVSFTVSEGEVFGFVGPNGAGKSTTIKVMLDVIDDYDGEVRLYGVSAREAAARRGVAYVPEAPALYEQFTPLEILRMALDMYGIRRDDREAWCMQWLERFSVAEYAKRAVRQLSKGNVQRVALAHAMVVSPRLLVLDEPLSGLDPVGRKDVVDILANYKRDGGAIFLTSHVLHDVERIADRFGFIHRGELITTRAPHELVAERADRYLVRYQAAAALGEAASSIRSGEFEQELAQADLPAFIARLQDGGGRIVTVKPAMSLETVFFQVLEGALKPVAEVPGQG